MKVAAPLSLKVALWLLLNLAVLMLAGAIFVGTTYGLNWEALLSSGAGERVHRLGANVAGELRVNPNQSLDELVARTQRGTGADLFLYLNSGEQIGGPAVTLPTDIKSALMQGPPREEPRGHELGGAGAGEPERRPPPPRRIPPGGPGPNGAVGFVRHAGDPASYWIGLRLPLTLDESRPPERGTLIVRVSSRMGLLRWLNFGPWLMAAAAAFGLSVLCWLPFVGGLRRAILGITRATEKIAEGRLDTRIATERSDELGALALAVNRMAEQLDAQVQGQKRFLGDVAHELGSPLSRLQVGVELLERASPVAQHNQIADVRDEVEQISSLVNELLAFTKAGLRSRDALLSALDLAPLIDGVIARDDPAGRVTVTVSSGVKVLADAALLTRAVSNLVRNALRYAAETPIFLTVVVIGETAVIAVADEGPGVPPEALQRLGEPFFRPDSARSRDTGGTGLGLAIVKSCIEACEGRVAFANRTPRGFSAEITLGLAR